MSNRTDCQKSRGFSLLELMVSLAGASVLMIALSSTLFIALRASDTANTPGASTLEGLGFLADISCEMQFAMTITERTATAFTFTVPDRADPDSNPETIRYAWSGVAGDPLTRQYNGGAVAIAVNNVHDLGFEYFQPASAVESVNVRIRVGSNPLATVETSIPFLNQP